MSIAKAFKIDLHIHTDYSNMTKNNDYIGSFSVKRLVEKLDEFDIQMFSMTDHNIFNVNDYKEYYNLYSENSDRIALIGVELDIFREEVLLNEIKNSKNNKDREFQKYHALLIFKSQNINDLNEKLEKMYKQIMVDYKNKFNDDISLLLEDIKIRSTSIERIVESFYGEDYMIIAHGRKDSGIVQAYKGNITVAQNMVLLGIINSLEMSPNKVAAADFYNKGFDSLLNDEYKGRSDIPYVVFSDNHEVDVYPNYKSDQIIENRPFTWIRGDLSFETLRLSFVDPTSRIMNDINPPKKPPKFLEEISFTLIDSKGKENDINIPLSPGINSIIGGRSSGKSLLLNAILYNLKSSQDKSNIFDYEKSGNKIIKIDSILGKLNTESGFKNINICETIAYKQEDIIKKFDDGGHELTSILPFMIFDEQEISIELEDSFKLMNDLSTGYKQIFESRNFKDVEFLKSDIVIASRVFNFEFSYQEGEDNLKSSIIEDPLKTEEKIATLNFAKKYLYQMQDFTLADVNIFDEDEQQKILDLIAIIKEKNSFLMELFLHNKFKHKFIDKLNTELVILLKTLRTENDTIIADATERLNIELEKAKKYFRARIYLEQLIEKLTDIKFDKKIKDVEYSNHYKLRSIVDYELNSKQFWEFIAEHISSFDLLSPLCGLLSLAQGELKIKRKSNIPGDFQSVIQKFQSHIKGNVKPRYLIIEKNDVRDISSEHMSPGKKASVFLDITLDNLLGKQEPHILLIDQPEDNLDNLFITEKLVERTRELRGKIQTIFVTHNASIAINSDSDNIIIAYNDNKQITYQGSGLENIEFRKEVCKILDGGHYIFDKRYHKYDIPKRKIYEPISQEEE